MLLVAAQQLARGRTTRSGTYQTWSVELCSRTLCMKTTGTRHAISGQGLQAIAQRHDGGNDRTEPIEGNTALVRHDQQRVPLLDTACLRLAHDDGAHVLELVDDGHAERRECVPCGHLCGVQHLKQRRSILAGLGVLVPRSDAQSQPHFGSMISRDTARIALCHALHATGHWRYNFEALFSIVLCVQCTIGTRCQAGQPSKHWKWQCA